jgi:hypothetical protein
MAISLLSATVSALTAPTWAIAPAGRDVPGSTAGGASRKPLRLGLWWPIMMDYTGVGPDSNFNLGVLLFCFQAFSQQLLLDNHQLLIIKE